MRKINDFRYFYPEKPKLLHKDQPLFTQLSKDPDWIAEPKWNDKRLQLHHLPNGEWQFWNRHGERLAYVPTQELLDALNNLKLKGYWLFDGGLRDGKVKGVRNRVVLYDVFIAEGTVLTDQTFDDRRGILEVLFHYCGPADGWTLDLAAQFETDFRTWFDSYQNDQEIEGLVLKNRKGKLALGRTGPHNSGWMWKVRKASGIVRF